MSGAPANESPRQRAYLDAGAKQAPDYPAYVAPYSGNSADRERGRHQDRPEGAGAFDDCHN